MTYGGSGTVGWMHSRRRTTVSARYSGNYSGDARVSEFSHYNQSAVFDLSRQFGNKWTLNMAGTGQDTFLSQSIFEPSSLGVLAVSPGSVADLAAGLSIGRFSNPQTGVALNGAPVGYSPLTAALLGTHALIYGVQATASYEYSSRLSFQIGSFATGGQHRYGDQTTGIPDNNLIPRSLGGTGSVSMSYALNPRTDIGLNVSETYLNTSLQKAMLSSASGSLSRKMGKTWFLRLSGGQSFTHNIEQSVGAPPTRQTIMGGSIGFRKRDYTLLGSYNRSGYDASSATIGQNNIMLAAWNWSHPRRSWALDASYSRNVTKNSGFVDLTGGLASVVFTQHLKHSLSLMVNCSYLRSRSFYLGNYTHVNVGGVRMSLGWTPQLRRSPPPTGLPETEEQK